MRDEAARNDTTAHFIYYAQQASSPEDVLEVIRKTGLTPEDVDHLLNHPQDYADFHTLFPEHALEEDESPAWYNALCWLQEHRQEELTAILNANVEGILRRITEG